MRVSREEMARSHQRIVDGASRLFRERGIENTSVTDVMEAAGLTHGGFYRHFDSKDALVGAAIQSAFAQVQSLMEGSLVDKDPVEALALYHNFYLSDGHLSDPASACPVATLSGDVARADSELKEIFSEGLNAMLDAIAQREVGTRKERRSAAIREFALLVGAAVIARASNAETSKAIRLACGTRE